MSKDLAKIILFNSAKQDGIDLSPVPGFENIGKVAALADAINVGNKVSIAGEGQSNAHLPKAGQANDQSPIR